MASKKITDLPTLTSALGSDVMPIVDVANDITKQITITNLLSGATTDLAPVYDAIAQNSLNILINSAAASSTLNDYDTMYLDIFSDADGLNDSVNTTNTTALYSSSVYVNSSTGSELELTGFAPTGTASFSAIAGHTITPTKDCLLTTATMYNTSPTHAYIYNEAGDTQLLKVATSGTTATFNYPLSAGVTYQILADKEGASYTPGRTTSGYSYPYTDANISVDGGAYNFDTTSFAAWSINFTHYRTKELTSANLVVEMNAQAVTTGATYSQLYCHNTTAGTGSITYDISTDGGSTYTTGLSPNEKNAFTSTTGTSMIVKINTNGTGAGNTAQVEDYAIMLFYD